METRQPSTHSPVSRGFTAIEVAIFMVAAMIVATIAVVAMLDLSGASANSGEGAAADGLKEATGAVSLHGPLVAVRGDVDIDGDNSINLAGNDRQAVVKLKMMFTADMASGVDLTPPYTVDDTGIDPDASGLTTDTVISVTTNGVSIPEAAWSVQFVGSNDGDYFLETGERAEVTVWLHTNDLANALYDLGSGSSDPFIDSGSDLLTARGQVTVRIIPRGAPATVIARTMPIDLTSTMILD